MPKEIVNAAPDHPDWQVEVAWGANAAFVALATTVRDPEVLKACAKEWLSSTSENIPTGLPAGFHVNLTHRSQVNDLIRKLRKARDSAFGKDE